MSGSDAIHLKGITWNHTRGLLPVVAAAQRFEELHPGVRISWEKRSLQEFADQPLAELGARYDLLVIDHPWAGFAATSGVLAPMEELVSAEFLADQAANSVGPSYASYRYGDRQWALAIDAATPVASWRRDLLEAHGVAPPEDGRARIGHNLSHHDLPHPRRRAEADLPAGLAPLG